MERAVEEEGEVTLERRLGAGMLEQPSDDPGLVLDAAGVCWLVAADGTRSELVAAPDLSLEMAACSGEVVEAAAIANLTLAHFADDELLDYSDPTHPTVLEAGVYAVTASVVGEASFTEDGIAHWDGSVAVGDWSAALHSPPATPTDTAPGASASLVRRLDAGEVVRIFVHSHLSDFTFSGSLFVQRLA